MDSLDIYPNEYSRPLKICIQMFNLCYINFFNDTYWSWRNISTLIISLLCVIPFYISFVTLTYEVLQGTRPMADLVKSVPVIMIFTGAIAKVVIMILNKSKVKYLIMELGKLWRATDLTTAQMKKKKVLQRQLMILQAWSLATSFSGTTSYVTYPVIQTVIHKFIKGQDYDYWLCFVCSYPFKDPDNWVLYFGLYVLQMYSMVLIETIYMAPEVMIMTLTSHLVTQLQLLSEDLSEINPDLKSSDQSDTQTRIKEFVNTHQQLLDLCDLIDTIFNKIYFVTMLFITVVICFFAFTAQITTDTPSKILNYSGVLGYFAHTLIMCNYGELLADASGSIADSAYKSLWYKGDSKHKKSIAIIMMRCQKECFLTSLKYAPITRTTFTKVLTTSWSYFSLTTGLYQDS